uniref:Uncharacterized protein n=1 Tax=Arundo donax TaxID=35708 RepID=A0A0A9BTK4_ARUDO
MRATASGKSAAALGVR